jgi:hypothetical protein
MGDRLRGLVIVTLLLPALGCEPGGFGEPIAGDWSLAESDFDDLPSADHRLTLDLRRSGTGTYDTWDTGSVGGGHVDYAESDPGVYRLLFWRWTHLHEKETVATMDCTLTGDSLVCDQQDSDEYGEFLFRPVHFRFERPA